MKFKTRLTALLTAAVMLTAMLPAAFAVEEDDPGYLDVAQNAWYYEAVCFASDRDLMSGYDSDSFGPTDTLKRSMLAQVFYNWEQQPYGGENEEKPWAGVAPFADVKAGVWYENAVNWARSEKVMQGDGANFNPDRDLNRQEMAVALYGYAGCKGVDRKSDAGLSVYADSADVASWAQAALEWAVTNKMLHIENNALAPTAPVQRGELAYALMSMAQSGSEADQVRLMAGARLESGSKLEMKDCAVIVEYHFHTGDWGEEELPMDEVVNRANDTAKANGYVPIGQVGQGSKVYAQSEPWEDGVSLVALGEDGTFRSGALAAEQGMNRRFAQTNVIWNGDGWDRWIVYSVVEADYYEENGQQHPCFEVVLVPLHE